VVNQLAQKGRNVANKLLAIQSLLAIVSALAFMLIDIKAAYSALLGGIICVVPNTIFVWYAYRFGGARAARQITNSFYKGEALKIMFTALMFAVTFIWLPISIGPLMTTYVLCLLAYWSIPFFGKFAG
jgi:ATP synthase protein I